MSHVRDLLAHKGFDVHTADADTTVLDATRQMNVARIGSLVVTDDGDHVVGIFSERDVLQRIVAEQRDPAATPIGDVMTKQVICVGPDTPADEVRTIMKTRRIRHIPVVNDQRQLVGLVSIGDLNADAAASREVRITYLEEYIYGRA